MSGLPDGWTTKTFGEVFNRLQYGFTAKAAHNVAGVRFLRITDLENGEINWSTVPSCEQVDDLKRYSLKNGDFVFARSGSIEKAARITKPPNAVFASYLIRGTPLNKEHADWLAWFVRSPHYLEQVRAASAGIGLSNVNAKKLTSITVPFPASKTERRRIVVKLDSLFKRSKSAREELARIPKLVERYRDAILATAFGGALTAKWRASTSRRLEDWKPTSIGEIAAVGTGATPKRGNQRFYENGTVPWVTSGAVNEAIVDHAEQMITKAALKETNCKVFPPGTLLVAMYGEGQTRGKVSILEIHAATNQALAAVSVRDPKIVSSKFIFWFFRANYFQLRRKAAGGVQPNLNLGLIKATALRLPSIEEQHEIVRCIEQLLQRVESLTRDASRPLELLDRLEQATLAKAYNGRLLE